jgi:hypothetical protein
MEPAYLNGITVRGFESRQGPEILLFTTASRPALVPTQPPIQRVPWAISLGVKWPDCEADRSPTSSAEGQRMCGAIPPLPNTPSWRGAHLKHSDTFTFTLPHLCIGILFLEVCNYVMSYGQLSS